MCTPLTGRENGSPLIGSEKIIIIVIIIIIAKHLSAHVCKIHVCKIHVEALLYRSRE